MVPIEDLSFFQCFRGLIQTFRLPPETSEAQLTEILRRVQEAHTAGPSGDGKRSANNSLWTNYDKPGPSAELLREYLEVHPEKRPVAIYVTGTLHYTYQPDIDGMVIAGILHPEGLPVVRTATGYRIDTGAAG